jgi:hypothetical protein
MKIKIGIKISDLIGKADYFNTYPMDVRIGGFSGSNYLVFDIDTDEYVIHNVQPLYGNEYLAKITKRTVLLPRISSTDRRLDPEL